MKTGLFLFLTTLYLCNTFFRGVMKSYSLLIFCLLPLLFVGCAIKPVIITKEYAGKAERSKSIGIIYAFPPGSIENCDDVADDLGAGNCFTVYTGYTTNSLSDRLKGMSEVTDVVMLPEEFLKNTSKQELSLPYALTFEERDFWSSAPSPENKTITVSLPADGAVFPGKPTVDYLVIFQNCKVERVSGSYETISLKAKSPLDNKGPYLRQLLRFTVWDNQVGKLVSYGDIEATSSLIFNMTKKDWASCVDQIATELAKSLPIKSRMHK